MRSPLRTVKCAIMVTMVCSLAAPQPVESSDSSSVASLYAGAIEAGVSGALTVVEGATRLLAALRAGSFARAPGGLWGAEIESSFSHVSSLNLLDFQGNLSWQPIGSPNSLNPFLALAVGVRQEWVGSFSQVRFPIGVNLGVRNMFDNRAAFRAEYRFRRVLADPISDFSEHLVVLGLSLFFRNH